MSGGPVADRKSAGRAMTAAVIAITAIRTVRRKAFSRLPLRPSPLTVPSASVTAADGATAAMISVNPVAMRRSKPQRLRRKVRRFANHVTTRAAPPASALRARAGNRTSTRASPAVGATTVAATKAGEGGRDKREGGPSHRQFATTAPPRERERPVDPNSPFAKLAALKEQLTANRKDQR